VSKSIGGTFNYGAQKVPEHFRLLAKQLRETELEVNPTADFAEINYAPVVEDEIVANRLARDSGV
jgi:hypothetical protein